MHDYELKLSEWKTEIILIKGSLKYNITPHVLENLQIMKNDPYKKVRPSVAVKDLGVYFDNNLSFNEHFNSIVKTSNYHLQSVNGKLCINKFRMIMFCC